MIDRVLVEAVIAAHVDAVWDAIRDPAKIAAWFGWDEPGQEDEIDFIFRRFGRADEAARILRFEGTYDRFELAERGPATRLRVIRLTPKGVHWGDLYEDVAEGWIGFIGQLRLAIERHDLAPRRTVHLSGDIRRGSMRPSVALGLAAASETLPGDPVSLMLATGDRIEGQSWHRTPFQFGVTVDDFGDGLLVVTDKPPTDAAPRGRGMVTLTTYGLDDARFAALEARWKNWWSLHYEKPAEIVGS